MPIEYFRFAPDILRRLGEELVPHPDQGIIELVRNAYDADARSCTVKLVDTATVGGSVFVSDDGDGMNDENIRRGWLVLGRSGKATRTVTRLGRSPVGDKGLGRLAALRLGTSASLRTRPRGQTGYQYTLKLKWSDFDHAAVVDDVPVHVDETQTSKSHGTDIEISDLRVALGRREVQRLARALVLLADPFNKKTGFRPKLLSPEFADFERLVRNSYFDEAEYRLVASLDSSGRASAEVRDWRDKRIWAADHKLICRTTTPYAAPAATFELWTFILDAKTFSSRRATLTEVRSWLAAVGGVHLYHRGLRVHPYGDQGHDWLEMNLARVRNPELRPGTNTSLGRMTVPDPDEALLEKTDRSGFVENDAFRDLRRFAVDSLDWMARERLRARERTREARKIAAPKRITKAKKSLNRALEKLPQQSRAVVERALHTVERARDRETAMLREEVELYRSLSTVGTTAAVFAHETGKPVTNIEKMAAIIRERSLAEIGERKYREHFDNPISIIEKSAHALKPFSEVPLRLLDRRKRRLGSLDVNLIVQDTVELFRPFLEGSKIEVLLRLVDPSPIIHGTESGLQAILANFVTNSISAFNKPKTKVRNRQLVVATERTEERVFLRVLDNGPGITDISLDDIWLPGQSTVEGGTGLGLSIVRDIVADTSGIIRAIAKGELGGAEFVIEWKQA